MKAILAAVAAMSLVGCASVVNGTSHGIRVDTKTASGEIIEGAACVATNNYGSTYFRSGTGQAIRRSSQDLDIKCTQEGQPPATGMATSRANAGMAGNIIIGGVVGAIVDHKRGAGYTYPTWIEMVFGQSLVFDRSQEKEGTVLKGYPAGMEPAGMRKAAVSSHNSNSCMYQVQGASCPK